MGWVPVRVGGVHGTPAPEYPVEEPSRPSPHGGDSSKEFASAEVGSSGSKGGRGGGAFGAPYVRTRASRTTPVTAKRPLGSHAAQVGGSTPAAPNAPDTFRRST